MASWEENEGAPLRSVALLPTSSRMDLATLLIPSLTNPLRAVSGWLDKAEAFAAEAGRPPMGCLPCVSRPTCSR